ncbi:MAG TPA: TetR/AcrR family transcriptional regulator, partial [Acidimicrobiales bacterium]
RILIEDGLDGVSLRRVAGSLGVTAPALYAYVKDKHDMLQGIADIELEDLQDRFGEVEGLDPEDRLHDMAMTYVNFARHNSSVFRAIFLVHPELAMRTADDEPSMTRVFQAGSAPIQELDQRGQLGETDAETAALAFWTAVHGAATVMASGSYLDLAERERAAETVINSVLSGLHGPSARDAGAA